MAVTVLIGSTGQLGTDLCQELPAGTFVPLTHAQIEVTDFSSVKKVLFQYRPDVIINTSAFHRTDDCETNPDKAFLVNAIGPRNLAVVAAELGAKLLHISTDYIFGGENREKNVPYTEFDDAVPLSTYGRSKLAGEKLVESLCHRYFIVRASGLFGVAGASGKGGNFVETMLKLGKEKPEIRVVADQVFSPTYTRDLARKIAEIINTEYYGIFHVTNRGICSWYEFTKEILRLNGINTPVYPITSAEYPQKAKRPPYSVLDNYQLRLLKMDDMPPWPDALRSYLVAKGHLKSEKP